MADPAFEINGAHVGREAFYAAACDPRRSVAVEACAGAGKTWMLVSRILRALLEGAAPQDILAITFTRKAAGEMRKRLQEWLQDFARMDLPQLEAELARRGVAPAQAQALAPALQGLHARVLGSGRGVQIRTFHGWFAALLRAAPLATLEQLGLPASHELLEDDSHAIDKVWRRFHTVVEADPAARADYEASVAEHGRWQTLKGLRSALDKRVEFALADACGVVEASVRHWNDLFPALAAFDHPEDSLDGSAAQARWLAWAKALGAQENKTPRKAADAVVEAFAAAPADRLARLRRGFFVASEDRLTQHLARYPAAQEAEAELQQLCRACAQRDAWQHQQRMARLTRVLVAQYAALKREEGWVDMSDVEQAAHRLLEDDVLAGWVQERLDARISHLLVDEFQDTNPLQWQALHAWLSGYAGAGGCAPSVFIVGDPKQSIYRFRRAEPQVFAAAQRFVREGLLGDLLSCDHTHRNSPAVIGVVNAVMSQAQDSGQFQGFRTHTTESAARGQVLRLPAVPRPVVDRQLEPEPFWRDSLTVPRELPEQRLVALECRQAARWIASQVAAGLAPADMMVLARRRDRLAAMEDELRMLGLPAQQPEKTDLSESPEVQDLVALLDVLVSPAHDLSLARVLKSPLLGAGDEALVALALSARRHAADGSPRPWLALLQSDESLPQELRTAGERLAKWKAWVDRWPPHDALVAIYQDADVLARYAQAVPPALREAALANLRALPGAALEVEGGRYLTPYALVRALKAGGIKGPVVTAEGAVQLLTVHGAKGLEAPVVLLLDTDAAPARADSMGVLLDWPGEAKVPQRLTFLVSETRPPACNAAALVQDQAARQREELNALYVAMTRARGVLALSSVQPRSAGGTSWWERLQPHADAVEVAQAPASHGAGAAGDFLLPIVPLPSALPDTPERRAPAVSSAASRFGQAVHRLLELHDAGAQVPASRLLRIAREFALDEPTAHEAQAMAARIRAGEGAWAWSAGELEWQGNEVELVHQGELLRLDRLVRRRGGAWWVLDYKSAARPEQDAALVAQLRRYGAAVAALHPGAPVELAFLTGHGRVVRVAPAAAEETRC